MAAALGMEITLRFTEPNRRQRAAIFVTREPHCLEGLLARFASGRLAAEPAVVISNRRDLEPLRPATQACLSSACLGMSPPKPRKAALELLREHEVDFIVLARFMKILSPNFVWRYKNKIINIHPSLLAQLSRAQAYRQAYEHGVKIVGVTAHFVSMHLERPYHRPKQLFDPPKDGPQRNHRPRPAA